MDKIGRVLRIIIIQGVEKRQKMESLELTVTELLKRQ